jgi:hypothetical protein
METHRTQGSPTAAHFFQTVRATFLVSVCSVAIIAVGSGKPIEAAQQSDATELIERIRFDWDHSGKLTTFSLVRRHQGPNGELRDRLVIVAEGFPAFRFSSSPTNSEDAERV